MGLGLGLGSHELRSRHRWLISVDHPGYYLWNPETGQQEPVEFIDDYWYFVYRDEDETYISKGDRIVRNSRGTGFWKYSDPEHPNFATPELPPIAGPSTLTVTILGSLSLIFPHFLRPFLLLLCLPFCLQCFPLFLRTFPLVSPLYFTHDTTFASFSYGTISFCLSWIASTCQYLPAHYLLFGTSPFTFQSCTIDSLANQRMPAPLWLVYPLVTL